MYCFELYLLYFNTRAKIIFCWGGGCNLFHVIVLWNITTIYRTIFLQVHSCLVERKQILKMANSIVFKLSHLYIFLLNFIYMLVSISSSMIIDNNKYIIMLMLCYFLINSLLFYFVKFLIMRLSISDIILFCIGYPPHFDITHSTVLLRGCYPKTNIR